jgi:hypothetical protein
VKYHPVLISIALISAALSFYVITAILFPDTSVNMAAEFRGEGAKVMWMALAAVTIAVVIYAKSNKGLIDRVLSGQATSQEVAESILSVGFFKKKD